MSLGGAGGGLLRGIGLGEVVEVGVGAAEPPVLSFPEVTTLTLGGGARPPFELPLPPLPPAISTTLAGSATVPSPLDTALSLAAAARPYASASATDCAAAAARRAPASPSSASSPDAASGGSELTAA